MSLILGIDDAGRGPVIGPMALAGVLLEESSEKELRNLGVRDSKQITPKRREFLAEQIRKKSESDKVILIYPEEIDSSKEKGLKLNELEANVCGKIIDFLNKGNEKIKVVVDCPSTSIVKWTDYLKTQIDNLSNLQIVCEHKADKHYVAVSAASILAKSEREKEVKKLKEKYGKDIGSGYPSDPKTKQFLSKNSHKKSHSKIFRKSWKTWQNATSKSKQKKLDF